MSSTPDPGPKDPAISSLLESSVNGDVKARDELLGRLYDELKRIAQRILRNRPRDVLQSTVLVHDAYLRLVGRELRIGAAVEWKDEKHFLCYMARAMRSVLTDAHKKGGEAAREAKRTPLQDLGSSIAVSPDDRRFDVLMLDDALERLAAEFPDLAKVEELRIFGGLTMSETAAVLGCGVKRVKVARAYLRDLLGDEP